MPLFKAYDKKIDKIVIFIAPTLKSAQLLAKMYYSTQKVTLATDWDICC